MTMVVAFYLIQLAVSGYAGWRGGAPERIVAAGLLTAAIAGTIATLPQWHTAYLHVFRALLLLDVALLLGLTAIALVADRYWPMWLAALQLVAVAAHGAKVYDPAIVAQAYWLLTSRMAYPMLFVLLMGTIRHRERLRAGLPEFAWWWSWRDERARKRGR